MRMRFNKGRLMNAAVRHIRQHFPAVDCLIMQDVDLLPMVCPHPPSSSCPRGRCCADG